MGFLLGLLLLVGRVDSICIFVDLNIFFGGNVGSIKCMSYCVIRVEIEKQ